MLNVILLVIEQRKNEFDRLATILFSSSIFILCEGCFINMKLHLECQIIEQRNKGLIAADIFYLYSNSSDF
jgi:hypothetical protein